MLRKILRLPQLFLAALCVGLILLLRPFILIRIGELCSFRIGHLAGNTECYLCQKDAGIGVPRQRYLDLWTHWGPIANKQLAKMYARVMPIIPGGFLLLVNSLGKCLLSWREHIAQPEQYDRDIHGLYEKQFCHIAFTEQEEKEGRLERIKLGIPDGARWVCLIVRDSAYLRKHEPKSNYHGYRDSDIDTYEEAALALANRGYYVLRMGEIVEKPFKARHPLIIDYAVKRRSDFMDIYLGAKCDFCISTGTGFDSIPTIFRRPVCYVNYLPLTYLMTFVPGFAIWKHHEIDGKRLNLDNIFTLWADQFLMAQQYTDKNITLVNNTAEEIKAVVLEMADYVEGKYLPDQLTFWNDFPRAHSPYNAKPLHGKIRCRIGSEFLRGYGY